jgi:hypothetical protein
MQTLMQNVASEGATGAAANAASHDKVLPRFPAALPSFPRDAVARIERLSRSAMTSAPSEPRDWRLVFERRTPPFIEPLMGWTGDRDPLAQLELRFPTLEAAVGYAQRQGLRYTVRHDARSRQAYEQVARRRRAFSDAMLGRLGLCGLQGMYGQAMANADASPPPATKPDAQYRE